MSSPELRFDDLIRELRIARPIPSAELRARVRAATAGEIRPQRRRRRLPARSTAFALAALSVCALVGAAVVHGLVSPGSAKKQAAPPATTTQPTVLHAGPRAKPAWPSATTGKKEFGAALAPSTSDSLRTALPPSSTRLQEYEAWMRIQVRDNDSLSRDTKRAMAVARGLGGYVASVNYNVPGARRGRSQLVLRVPVDRVEEAIAKLSSLGTIVAQHVNVKDVQHKVAQQTKEIARLEADIARIEKLLAGPLSPEDRARLELRLAAEKRLLSNTRRDRGRTLRRSELARISLTLTTKPAKAAAPHHPSRFDRTMSDAGHVLGRELTFLLYVLIVAGPFLVLGAAALLLGRLHARRANDRLLERA